MSRIAFVDFTVSKLLKLLLAVHRFSHGGGVKRVSSRNIEAALWTLDFLNRAGLAVADETETKLVENHPLAGLALGAMKDAGFHKHIIQQAPIRIGLVLLEPVMNFLEEKSVQCKYILGISLEWRRNAKDIRVM
jgi:hypothetical protein